MALKNLNIPSNREVKNPIIGKSINTAYNNILFRSTLEAKWAVFFDELQLEYKMEQQPPTFRQIEYLKALGYKGEIESKYHASVLIQKFKNEGRNPKWP